MNLEMELDSIHKSLQNSRSLLKQVFHYLPEGVLICNISETIEKLYFWNSSFIEILQAGCPQSLDQNVTVSIMKEIQIKTPANRSLENQQERLFEQEIQEEQIERQRSLNDVILEADEFQNIQFKRINSEQHLQLYKIKLEDSLKTLIFLRDITAIHRNSKQKVHQQMQSIFLSSISHDLKTPINQVLLTSQYFQQKYPHSEDLRVYRLQEGSCNFMLSLIDDIVDLSKLQLNKFEQNKTLFILEDLFHEIFELFELKIKEKNLNLTYEIQHNVTKYIFLDRKRLKQIIMNLLSNAVKFTMVGSINLKAELKDNPQIISTNNNRNREENQNGEAINNHSQFLLISVSDTGVGISQEGKKKLFKLFGMLNKTRSINPNGTGLGLMICKRLSEAMDGSIAVHSEENVGSTFTVQILLEEVDQNFAEDEPLDSSRSINSSNTQRVEQLLPLSHIQGPHMFKNLSQDRQVCQICSNYLIIDDDSFNILSLELLFETLGKGKIDSALSAKLGIQKMEKKLKECCQAPYKFIIVDLNMPEMNGEEMVMRVAEMIQSNQNGMACYAASLFILCTAQTQIDKEELKRKGFRDFLDKPVKLQELENILRIDEEV